MRETWQRSLEMHQRRNGVQDTSKDVQWHSFTDTGVTFSTQHHQELDRAIAPTEVATSTLPTELNQDEGLHDGNSDLMIISEDEDDRLVTDETPVHAVALDALHYNLRSQTRIPTASSTDPPASVTQPQTPNAIGAVLCCTTVELPIYQALNGQFIRIVPGILPHGHISNVPAIADPDVREWYFGDVGTPETRFIFVQPNGDVHEIVLFGRAIGHQDNVGLMQDVEVHDASQQTDRMTHISSEQGDDNKTAANALTSPPPRLARSIVYTSLVQLPVVRTPSGHIVRFGAGNVVHGHMNDIDNIQDETVRHCYTYPTNKNIAEPVCTLRDGTIIETVPANKIVGRADDLTTVQDPVVRRAMGI